MEEVVKYESVVFGYGSMTSHGFMISDQVVQVEASATIKVYRSFYYTL